MQTKTKTFATAAALALCAALGTDRAEAAPSVKIEHQTLIVEGGPEADRLALQVPGEAKQLLQIDLDDDGSVDHELHRNRFDRIRVEGAAGDDAVRVEGPSRFAGLEPIRLQGGDGQDALALDGSDTGERFRLAPGNDHLRLSRNVGHVRIALGGLERLDIAARGGADRLELEDLSGAELQEIHTDLEDDPGTVGTDQVSVNGSNEQEQISVLGFANQVFVIGSPVFVQIDNPEPSDRLRVNGRRGSDLISSSTTAMTQTLDGGEDIDTLFGGPGDDVLVGGGDFDDVAGRQGDDVAHLGDAPDRFTWNPGDGNDVVEGGAGHDSISFNGGGAAELLELTANGRRLQLTRDIDSITMDLNDLEEINTMALGGADTISVGDLRRTGVDEVHANLAPSFGTPDGDGAADRVVVTGTERKDTITVSGQNRVATVTGLSALVGITHAEPLDTLVIATAGGDDSVDSAGLAPDTIGLVVE